MTTPAGSPPTPSSSPPPATGGPALGVGALIVLALAAAAIFWAGLSLGAGSVGRNEQERAAIAAFAGAYQRIADDFIGTPLPEAVLEGAIEGMFDVLDDPYSRYMPPDEYDAALNDARGEFDGVGAVMATEDATGEPCEPIAEACRLVVREVLAGAPAEAAGLRAGDVVTGVDGSSLEGSTIDDSVLLIRGPRGTQVTLTVLRDDEVLELPISRDKVVADEVHAATLADGRVGYIAVDGFSAGAAEDFAHELGKHLDAGVEGLIVDVRDDPGGFVDAAVEISSQFLADGAVFWEEDASGSAVAVDVVDGGLAADDSLAVVLLINGGTASASEILGGALQDAGRATLVGQRTFGKGTVQEWNELPGQVGGYRLSVARWLTRDKRSIDGVGLVPDVVVGPGERRFRAGAAAEGAESDDQLQTALSLLLDVPAGRAASSPQPATSPG